MKTKCCLRVLALLGFAFLFLVLQPVQADAATVCKIGSKKYSSLQEAINAVKNGETIKVKKNISETKEVNLANGKTYTIDFANHSYTYSGTGYNAFSLADPNSPSKVTIKRWKVTSNRGVYINKGHFLTIQSGSYTGPCLQMTGGSLLIQGGTFQAKPAEDWQSLINVDWDSGAVVEISGGTFTGYPGRTIIQQNGGTITISGGKFTAEGNSVLSSFGTAKITGGNFRTRYNREIDYKGNVIAALGKGKMTITGGSFTGERPMSSVLYVDSRSAGATIKGGTFSGKIWAVHAEGPVKIKKGTFKGDIRAMGAGKITIQGGKCTTGIVAMGQGTITISKVTVKQGTPLPLINDIWKTLPCLLAIEQGKITVKGGSFTSPEGIGYYGNVVFKTSGDYKNLFYVKTLKGESWN